MIKIIPFHTIYLLLVALLNAFLPTVIVNRLQLRGNIRQCMSYRDSGINRVRVIDMDDLMDEPSDRIMTAFNLTESIKECGNNALEILFGFQAGSVYSDYALIPFEMDAVNVQTSSDKKEIHDYEELKEWWSYEE